MGCSKYGCLYHYNESFLDCLNLTPIRLLRTFLMASERCTKIKEQLFEDLKKLFGKHVEVMVHRA